MNRRSFITQTGLASAAITTTGLPQVFGLIIPKKSPFTGKPRPEDWIEKKRWEMHDFLSQGSKIRWTTGYSQPCRNHGWELVDRVPLNLIFEEKRLRGIPGSLAFYEDVTYCWTEIETAVGPVRVDYLGNNVEDMIQMKLFMIELNGDPLGQAGAFTQDPKELFTNWYAGIQRGDMAYAIKDSQGFGSKVYKNAHLEIWEKMGNKNNLGSDEKGKRSA